MAYNNNRQFSQNGRRNFGGNNGGGNRGSFKGGRSFRNNGSGNNEQNYELRGIIWGNKFRDEQKEGAPVLQGYATVNGVKYRVAGFLNVGPDFKDDRGAQQEKEAIAQELNNILLDAQEQLGIAFSLTFEDEEERQANNQGGGGQRGGQRRESSGGGYRSARRGGNQQEEENIPFNAEQEEGEAEEPADEPAPRAPRAPRRATTKAAAKSTKTATTRSRKGSK
jgi:hypothetical protein